MLLTEIFRARLRTSSINSRIQIQIPSKHIFLDRSVIPPNSVMLTIAGKLTNPLYPALKAEELAAAMIEVAVNGGSEQIIPHDELKNKGRALLDRGE